jgi:hypothetical protein
MIKARNMRNVVKFCFLLSIMLTPLLTFADTEAMPRSYVSPSANNKFLFVMIASIEIQQDGLDYGDEGKKEAQRIRAKYPSSGMYLNDGSTNPLWTVDWYSNSVMVASDGNHIIRLGPWATSLSDEAFTIFEQNNVVRSYKIGELVATDLLLPHSVSHFEWEEAMSLNNYNHTLFVSTLSKERYIFDFFTGETISSEKPVRMWFAISGVTILFLIIFVLMKRKRLVR